MGIVVPQCRIVQRLIFHITWIFLYIQLAKMTSGSSCLTGHGWNLPAFGGLVNVKPWSEMFFRVQLIVWWQNHEMVKLLESLPTMVLPAIDNHLHAKQWNSSIASTAYIKGSTPLVQVMWQSNSTPYWPGYKSFIVYGAYSCDPVASLLHPCFLRGDITSGNSHSHFRYYLIAMLIIE